MTPSAAPRPAVAPLAVDPEVLAAVAQGRHHDPHTVLGAHPHPDGAAVTYRVLRPLARTVTVVRAGDGQRVELTHEHDGVFAGVAPTPRVAGAAAGDYRVEVAYETEDGTTGPVQEQDDAYRHLPTLGELDLHLIGEGRHERLWEVLGARVVRTSADEAVGTAFAVWAPNARAVRVVGDHNGWDGRTHAMRSLGSSGVWELLAPGVGHGDRYKFEILGRDGLWRQKADPMARWTEVPPATASRVLESDYAFGDRTWMERRRLTDPHERPLSIYEVHLGSWRPGLDYRELAEQQGSQVRAEAEKYAKERKANADEEGTRIVDRSQERASHVLAAAEKDAVAKREEAQALFEETRAKAAQAAAEFETNLAKRRDQAERDLAKRQAAAEKRLSEIESRAEQLRLEAEKLRADAERRSRQTIETAQRQADDILADARAKADRQRAESERELNALTHRRDSINAQLTNVREMLATLTGAAVAAGVAGTGSDEDDSFSGGSSVPSPRG